MADNLHELPYQPRLPDTYSPRIAVIGCGNIARTHLEVYRHAGLDVGALVDVHYQAAEECRDAYYPGAEVFTDYRQMLERFDGEVVDVTTQTDVRPDIIGTVLRARRHVLSQKPFVEDLSVGVALCDLADEMGVKLAVNQNARWSPQFSYALAAVDAGLVGDVASADFSVYWWQEDAAIGTQWAQAHDLVLLDDGIHWFDLVASLFGPDGPEPESVYARVGRIPNQRIEAPLQAHVTIDYPECQVALAFRCGARHGSTAAYRVTGTEASIENAADSHGDQRVLVSTSEGREAVDLDGTWFVEGFLGTMGELLCAIEEDREPTNSARSVLPGLRLCFAAIESSRTGRPVNHPVQKLPNAPSKESG